MRVNGNFTRKELAFLIDIIDENQDDIPPERKKGARIIRFKLRRMLDSKPGIII